MPRAGFLIVAVFLISMQAPTLPLGSWGPAPGACQAANVANLRDRLEKGLKARRPQEFDFIDQVVTLVEKDTLKRKLVDSTFLWARRKPKNQFQYFEHAMRLRAKRAGVNLK